MRVPVTVGLVGVAFLLGMSVQAAITPVGAALKPRPVALCGPAGGPTVIPLTEAPTIVIPPTLIIPPPTTIPSGIRLFK